MKTLLIVAVVAGIIGAITLINVTDRIRYNARLVD
jgi:hypothetical protein